MKNSVTNTYHIHDISYSDSSAIVKQKLFPVPEIIKSFEYVSHLIKNGKGKEAKEKFPFEWYLVKKYLNLNTDDFLHGY